MPKISNGNLTTFTGAKASLPNASVEITVPVSWELHLDMERANTPHRWQNPLYV